MYDSTTMAKYIVATANERGTPINITKTQKLLYIAYGVFLAVKGERLTDEHPKAWPYGPVFPRTRNKLLRQDLYSINFNDKNLIGLKGDEEIKSLVGLVFDSFGEWTASQLTEWSHRDGTPWQRTVSSKAFDWGDTIPDEYIKPYFASIIKHDEAKQ